MQGKVQAQDDHRPKRVLARVLAEDLAAVSGGCDKTTKSNSCGEGCDRIVTDCWKLCDDQY